MNNENMEIRIKVDFSVESFVRAFDQLAELFTNDKLSILSSTVDFKVVKTDSDELVTEYYELSDEEIGDNADRIDFAHDIYLSKDAHTKILSSDKLEYAEIYSEYQRIEDVSSLRLLLKSVSVYLNGLDKSMKMLDVKFKDFINDDGLSRPSYALYLAKDEAV